MRGLPARLRADWRELMSAITHTGVSPATGIRQLPTRATGRVPP